MSKNIGLNSKKLTKNGYKKIENFFEVSLPENLLKEYQNIYPQQFLEQQHIMRVIDFTPPFLKIEKIVVFGDINDVEESISLGMGVVDEANISGYYHGEISLGTSGWFMAHSASIHLAALYPDTAPQVVKADGVENLVLSLDRKESTNLWKGKIRFWVVSRIKKKKMKLFFVETKLFLKDVLYGKVEELRMVLTPRKSIWAARPIENMLKREVREVLTKNRIASEIEKFFTIELPEQISSKLEEKIIDKKLVQKEIMDLTSFHPPFLKIDKIVVLKDKIDDLARYSLGTGLMTKEDAFGHYNSTVFLAMCTWLMTTSACVHLGLLFPDRSLQDVIFNGVMPLSLPLERRGLWQPDEKGTVFFTETNVVSKENNIINVETKIIIEDMPYGVIKQLKIILFHP